MNPQPERLRILVRAAVAVAALCVVGLARPAVAQNGNEPETDDGGAETSESTAEDGEPDDEEGSETSGEESDASGDTEEASASDSASEETDASDEAKSSGAESEQGSSSDSSERSSSEAGDGSVTQTGRPVELQEAVRRAKTNEALLEEFEAKRDQAEWKQYRAKWARFPKVSANTKAAPVPANADPDRLDENVDEISSLNIGPFISQDIELVVPVFTFGKISTLRKLSGLGIDVAKLKKREAQLNVVFQSKRAYYSLQLSRTFREMLREGEERIEKKLAEMQEARDFGTADFETKDLRKLQIFSSEVDSRRTQNQKLAEVSSSGLKYLAEYDTDRLKVGKLETDDDPRPLYDRSTYLRAAKEHRPELAQLEKAIRARELQVKLAKKKFYPDVFVAGAFGLSWSTEETARQPVCQVQPDGECVNTTELDDQNFGELRARPDSDPLDRFSARIGLGMRWNLDFPQRRGKLGERQSQLQELRAQRRRALGAIQLEIKKKYEDAHSQRRRIGINDNRLEAARRWRDQLGFSIESAGADMEDAIEPLKAFYQAKVKYLRSRYKYRVARAALAQSVGLESLDMVEAARDEATTDGRESAQGPVSDG